MDYHLTAPFGKKTVFFILSLFWLYGVSLASDADSAAYFQLREKMMLSSQDSTAISILLSTTDKLARQGLFSEAQELLNELSESGDSSAIPLPGEGESDTIAERILGGLQPFLPEDIKNTAAPVKKPLQWYILSTSSYGSMRDSSDDNTGLSDTSGILNFTVKQKDISQNVKASLTWSPPDALIKTITSWIQGEYDKDLDMAYTGKATLGADISSIFFHNHFRLNGSLQGDLWIRELFKDSSDLIKAKLNPSFSGDLSLFSYTLDGLVGVNRFRYNRPACISFWYFIANPYFSVNSGDYSRSITIGMQYMRYYYDTYISLDRDTSQNDYFQVNPWTTLTFMYNNLSLNGNGSFTWERYPLYKNKTDGIFAYDRYETDAGATFSHQTISWLELDLLANGIFVTEKFPRYQPDIDKPEISFDKKMHTLALEPGVSIFFPCNLQMDIAVTVERQRFNFILPEKDTAVTNTLEESEFLKAYNAYTPAIRFSYDASRLNFSVGCSLLFEMVKKESSVLKEGNFWELQPDLSISFIPWSWCTLGFDMMYYYHEPLKGKSYSSDLFLSLTLGATF
jgi:hypothetical protein